MRNKERNFNNFNIIYHHHFKQIELAWRELRDRRDRRGSEESDLKKDSQLEYLKKMREAEESG